MTFSFELGALCKRTRRVLTRMTPNEDGTVLLVLEKERLAADVMMRGTRLFVDGVYRVEQGMYGERVKPTESVQKSDVEGKIKNFLMNFDFTCAISGSWDNPFYVKQMKGGTQYGY